MPTVSLGVVSGGGSPQAITPAKVVNLGTTSGTESLQPMTVFKSLGVIVDGEAPQPMTVAKVVNLGVVTETSTVNALTAEKVNAVQLGLVTATESPNSIIPLNGPIRNATEYVYMNFGWLSDRTEDGTDYIYVNVGAKVDPTEEGTDYVYLGDVNEECPTPHIWCLDPDSGAGGGTFTVIGKGFGADITEYSTQVEFGNDIITVLDHTRHPTTDDTDSKVIESCNPDNITLEHTTLLVEIPAGEDVGVYAVQVCNECPE